MQPSSNCKVEALLSRFPGSIGFFPEPITLDGIAVSTWRPSSPDLLLDAEGFQQHVFFFTMRSLWRDVSNFTISRVVNPFSGGATPVIWYHDRRRENWWFSWFWKLNRFNAGVNPVEGLSIEELAHLITRWRERALAQASVKQ
jgi:hypothetical protein